MLQCLFSNHEDFGSCRCPLIGPQPCACLVIIKASGAIGVRLMDRSHFWGSKCASVYLYAIYLAMLRRPISRLDKAGPHSGARHPSRRKLQTTGRSLFKPAILSPSFPTSHLLKGCLAGAVPPPSINHPSRYRNRTYPFLLFFFPSSSSTSSSTSSSPPPPSPPPFSSSPSSSSSSPSSPPPPPLRLLLLLLLILCKSRRSWQSKSW